jgi:hypothetical protein
MSAGEDQDCGERLDSEAARLADCSGSMKGWDGAKAA